MVRGWSPENLASTSQKAGITAGARRPFHIAFMNRLPVCHMGLLASELWRVSCCLGKGPQGVVRQSNKGGRLG